MCNLKQLFVEYFSPLQTANVAYLKKINFSDFLHIRMSRLPNYFKYKVQENGVESVL